MSRRHRNRKKTDLTGTFILLSLVEYLGIAIYTVGDTSTMLISLLIPIITVFCTSKYWKQYRQYKKNNDNWYKIKVNKNSVLLSPTVSIPLSFIIVISVFAIGYDLIIAKLTWQSLSIPKESAMYVLGRYLLTLIHAITLYITVSYLVASYCYYKNKTMFAPMLNAAKEIGASYITELTWIDFENLIKQFFIARGYKAETTNAGADGGKDVILQKDGVRYLVQCKHWRNNLVGVSVAREMIGVLETDPLARHIYLITSGSFTNEAVLFRQRVADKLTLIDGRELQHFLSNLKA